MSKTTLAALAATLLMAACGGSDGDTSAACPVPQEQAWLRSYMADAYLWAGRSPNPAPDAYATVQAYFDALKFQGDGTVPADRWSFSQSTASFQQFFGDGQALGYGIFVNGVERVLPLKVRYTEPNSPAAAQLLRGDTIVSINGRTSADLVAANDNFAMLTPAKPGDTLQLVVDRGDGAGPRNVTLTAAVYALKPVPLDTAPVFTAANNTKVGYVALKDFIAQAEAPLAAAIASIRAAGATELIVDLRYNGGGLVSTARALGSLVAGVAGNGKTFATLKYNGRPGHPDKVSAFSASSDPAFSRVYVLTGSRTCSASELVVNGLRPVTTVVTIGGTTCGKPVGFDPVAQCGSTYSIVTFESVNGAGVGGYYDGLSPTCAVADDFTGALGSAGEKLTAAALGYAATGACPVTTASAPHDRTAAALRRRVLAGEPGEQRGMWAD